MNNKKVIKLIEKESKKMGVKPLFYRDEGDSLWVGCKTAIYRLDPEVTMLPTDWMEKNMDGIIKGYESNQVETMELYPVLYEAYSSLVKENIICKLLMNDKSFSFAQLKYIELLEDEPGSWQVKMMKYITSESAIIYFIDDEFKVKAVIAGITNKNDEWDGFLKLASLIKGEGE